MISVVCWKWAQLGYRFTFGPESVNILAAMVKRHYGPARVICVTNDSVGIDRDVEIVPDREDFAAVKSPHGANNPSCYRRLRMFAPDAVKIFGERFVSLDLDCVITQDMRPVWDRPEDFVGWRDPQHRKQYNGSMMLLKAGSRPEVWNDFDPTSSPRESVAAGFRGSDQGWISYRIPNEPRWTKMDGVCSFAVNVGNKLPESARIVFFHGQFKPWSPEAQRLEWVKEHWHE